ncbi:MAG: serine/threonine-protein kinase [Chitinophagaceae bacterium]|nr:serine/threonine-protein kinase [Anaerolineae bacterium]
MPETTQFGNNDDNRSEGTLKANTILVNRYKILGQLGGGGQGAVYQARDLNFSDIKRLVAIKEMLYPSNDVALRSSTFKTFQREANILATLAHPAIPKIFDFFDQNSRAYLVMEYINGSDIEILLNKTKELPVEKILEWAIDMCDVLQYLHTQPEPIIFRDIKPANIMIDSLGKVRLIDFGIAKIFVTGQKHTMIGTEGYSAPEQYKGDVTPLSDIYSLGATLHHIITRKDPRLEPPFSFPERPIKDYNNKVAPGFIEIIEKALQMKPDERFQSCAEMKEALDRLRYRPIAAGAGTTNGIAAPAEGTGFFKTGDLFGSTIEPRWKFKTEDEIRCSPTAYRDLAYIGSYDHNVWAVKLENGEFVWKYPTNAGIASSPVVDESNKLVLFGSEDNTFNAVDIKSGRINWSYMTKDRVRGTPRVAHDHVFFGSDDGRVYALVAGNGRYLWEYDMGAPVRTRPYVTNDFVIVGAESGEIVALELSGARKWGHRTRRNVTSSPFVDEVESICYVGSFDGHMYALDATNGYSMWRFRTNGPIISSAALDDDLLFFGSADGNLYAVNAETAKEKWKFNTEKPIVASPVVYQGSVYFGGTDGNLYCVDARNGKELWKFPTGSGITSTPYIVGDILLIGSMDKTLYALPLVG